MFWWNLSDFRLTGVMNRTPEVQIEAAPRGSPVIREILGISSAHNAAGSQVMQSPLALEKADE